MTLIFTNPLFTMILAAIFMGHRLSATKCVSALVLMAGIILVTKPPFLFPETHSSGNGTDPNVTDVLTSVMNDYLDRDFILYDLTPVNWTTMTDDATFVEDVDPHELYFVGALIALSSAVFSAANNIIMAKFGGVISASLQLFYIGLGGMLVAGLCQFVDEGDRFFTQDIYKITGNEWGICIGLALIGMVGFGCTIYSLIMIPPSTAATLRTSQIIVAFIAQIIIMNNIPAVLDIMGASLIFVAAMAITFEPMIQRKLASLWRRLRGRTTAESINEA